MKFNFLFGEGNEDLSPAGRLLPNFFPKIGHRKCSKVVDNHATASSASYAADDQDDESDGPVAHV